MNKFKALSLPKKIALVVAAIVLFGCCGTISSITGEDGSSISQETDTQAQAQAIYTETKLTAEAKNSPTPEPTATVPLPPLEQYKVDLENKLGKNNRDLPSVTDVHLETDKNLWVTIPANDNFSDELIIIGMLNDIIDALDLSRNVDGWDTITVIITFSMQDTYGNAKEANVIAADYSRETVDKIQFDNFLTKNTLVISNQENLFIHPAVRKIYLPYIAQ